jgi:hypothetical protein
VRYGKINGVREAAKMAVDGGKKGGSGIDVELDEVVRSKDSGKSDGARPPEVGDVVRLLLDILSGKER